MSATGARTDVPKAWNHVIRGADVLHSKFVSDKLPRQVAEVVWGGGKTAMAAHLVKKLKDDDPNLPVLVAVPTDELRTQFVEEFATWGVHNGQAIRGATFPASFDPTSVAVMTYATLSQIVSRSRFPESWRDSLCILDEGHHGPADVLSSNLRTISPRFLLSMTATPYRTDGRSMVELLGPITFRYLADQAIREGRIRKVTSKLEGLAFPRAETTTWRDVARARRIEMTPEQQIDRFKSLVLEHYPNAGQRRIIGYCSSIAQAKRYARLLEDRGYPDSVALWDSSNTREENAVVLQRYKDGEAGLLLTVNKANEGLNIPSTTGVVMFDSTISLQRYLQRIGRAGRAGIDCDRYLFDFGHSLLLISRAEKYGKDLSEEFDLMAEFGADLDLPERYIPERRAPTQDETRAHDRAQKTNYGEIDVTSLMFDATEFQRANDWTPERILLGAAKAGIEPRLLTPTMIRKMWGYLPNEGIVRSALGTPDLAALALARVTGRPAFRNPQDFVQPVLDMINTGLPRWALLRSAYLGDKKHPLPFSESDVKRVFGTTAEFYAYMRRAANITPDEIEPTFTDAEGPVIPIRFVTIREMIEYGRHRVLTGDPKFQGDWQSRREQWSAISPRVSTLSMRSASGSSRSEVIDWFDRLSQLLELANSTPPVPDRTIEPVELVLRIASRMIENGSRVSPTIAWLSRESLFDPDIEPENIEGVFENHMGLAGLAFVLARTLDPKMQRTKDEMRDIATTYVAMVSEIDELSNRFVPDDGDPVLAEVSLSASKTADRDVTDHISTDRGSPNFDAKSNDQTSILPLPVEQDDGSDDEIDERSEIAPAAVPISAASTRPPIPAGAPRINVKVIAPRPEWHAEDKPSRITHLTPRPGTVLVTIRDQLLILGDYPTLMVCKSLVTGRVGKIHNEIVDRWLDERNAAVVGVHGTVRFGKVMTDFVMPDDTTDILDKFQQRLVDAARLRHPDSSGDDPAWDQQMLQRVEWNLDQYPQMLGDIGSQAEPIVEHVPAHEIDGPRFPTP